VPPKAEPGLLAEPKADVPPKADEPPNAEVEAKAEGAAGFAADAAGDANEKGLAAGAEDAADVAGLSAEADGANEKGFAGAWPADEGVLDGAKEKGLGDGAAGGSLAFGAGVAFSPVEDCFSGVLVSGTGCSAAAGVVCLESDSSPSIADMLPKPNEPEPDAAGVLGDG
jgi:hypothetical protein